MPVPAIQEWRQNFHGKDYLVSTSRSLAQLSLIRRAFADPLMYWTELAPDHDLSVMLDNSCHIGLYEVLPAGTTSSPAKHESPAQEQLQQIGMARLLTDYITFAYLTDVFVIPECQGLGLGKWLVKCTREIIAAMPQLRRAMLLTGKPESVRFYERELEFNVHENADAGKGLVIMMGKPQPRQ